MLIMNYKEMNDRAILIEFRMCNFHNEIYFKNENKIQTLNQPALKRP